MSISSSSALRELQQAVINLSAAMTRVTGTKIVVTGVKMSEIENREGPMTNNCSVSLTDRQGHDSTRDFHVYSSACPDLSEQPEKGKTKSMISFWSRKPDTSYISYLASASISNPQEITSEANTSAMDPSRKDSTKDHEDITLNSKDKLERDKYKYYQTTLSSSQKVPEVTQQGPCKSTKKKSSSEQEQVSVSFQQARGVFTRSQR